MINNPIACIVCRYFKKFKFVGFVKSVVAFWISNIFRPNSGIAIAMPIRMKTRKLNRIIKSENISFEKGWELANEFLITIFLILLWPNLGKITIR